MELTELANPVTTAYEFLEVLERRWRGLGSPRYFRGEPRKHNVPFMPKIWRPDHAYSDEILNERQDPRFILTQAEHQSIQQCQRDFADGVFSDPFFSKFFDTSDTSSSHWLALAQHWNYPTRLIDITMQPLGALYFACCSDPDDPGFVYFFAGNHNYLTAECQSPRYNDFFDVYQVGDKHPRDDTLFVYEPPLPNSRMAAQHGLFAWVRAVNTPCWKGGGVIEIAAGAKGAIADTLAEWNYSHGALFNRYSGSA
jgi:hypothetical protein